MEMSKKFKRLISSIIVMAFVLGTMLIPNTSSNAANATLLNTYGSLFGRSGTCINLNQLKDPTTLSHVKSQYNSITLENEMKPDAMLGYSPTLITKDAAKSLGYYIPSNYTETYVPKINFDRVDEVLKIAYENGLGVRAHTLLWHAQTPKWFFRTGFSTNYGYVSQSTMDARMEYYIKSVINHVYTGKYGSVVYSWDVVNEYLHATDSGWEAVYGAGGTSPAFVKRAFQFAYDSIDYFGLTNSVGLFYNDFNTYMEVNNVISLINYINSGKKICNGIGMQSHLGTNFPSVSYYTAALQSFVNAGFEVQITELDVTNKDNVDQANYLYDLMKSILSIKKKGANITGLTWWGLSDDVTWIDNATPLLFSKLGVAKYGYYRVLDAYTDSGYVVGGSGNSGGSNTGTPNGDYATLKDGWYYIKDSNSKKYLQVANNAGGDGVNVEIGTGAGSLGQRWYLTNSGNGYVTLKNGHGYMLDVRYGSLDDGANIQTYSSNGADAQKFKLLNTTTSGMYGIATKITNDQKSLDVFNFGTSDGTNVNQWTYYGNSCQKWTFEPYVEPSASGISNGWYYIKNTNSNKYLQVANNGAGNGINVEIGNGSGSSAQKWYVTNDANGYITLKNGLGYMLDVQYGSSDNGANIQTYSANGADAQKFKVKTTATSGVYGIVTKASGDKSSLDVYNWSTAAGANVCQWTYAGNANQLWRFEATSN